MLRIAPYDSMVSQLTRASDLPVDASRLEGSCWAGIAKEAAAVP